jgi:hypothetical protein
VNEVIDLGDKILVNGVEARVQSTAMDPALDGSGTWNLDVQVSAANNDNVWWGETGEGNDVGLAATADKSVTSEDIAMTSAVTGSSAEIDRNVNASVGLASTVGVQLSVDSGNPGFHINHEEITLP